jgi:hypothetical protein
LHFLQKFIPGPLGYPQQNNLANGLLVGPGGPTGIIGRPGFSPYQGGAGGGYPGGGFSHPGYPPRQPFGFEGQHNGIGGGQFNPAFAGGGGGFGQGINPYGGGLGGGINPYNQQFGGNPYGPYYDSQGKNSAVKKIEKSAKSN